MMTGEYLGLVLMTCKDEQKNLIYMMYNINIWNIVCSNAIVTEIVKNTKNQKFSRAKQSIRMWFNKLILEVNKS